LQPGDLKKTQRCFPEERSENQVLYITYSCCSFKSLYQLKGIYIKAAKYAEYRGDRDCLLPCLTGKSYLETIGDGARLCRRMVCTTVYNQFKIILEILDIFLNKL